MDFNRLINMVINTVLRRFINTGINKGMNFAAKRGKSNADMTPNDHAQANAGRDMAKRARKAARVTRRLGR